MKHLINISFLIVAFFLTSCFKDESDDVSVVINELMPLNSTTVADQDGEYDDWIELYNNSSKTIDLSGYYLSDDKDELTKWVFPSGTEITGKGYLIIWADKDTLQNGLHANFRLSADGERVLLTNPKYTVVDKVRFDGQTSELTYSRIPNGTGSFSWQYATFDSENVKTLK